MANPRSGISFEGIDAQFVTAIIDGVDIVYDSQQIGGSAVVGRAVTISGNGTVRLTADASPVAGKLILVEPDGKCNIQFEGFVGLPSGTGAVLTPGLRIVGALLVAARGYIRGIVPATLADVAAGRGMIWEASDVTNVYVDL